MDRISTGNAQADLILGGGFPAHSINIVMGQPGSGKTVFSEQLAFANVSGRPDKVQRVVADALGDLIKASRDVLRVRDYAYALTQRFARGSGHDSHRHPLRITSNGIIVDWKTGP